MMKRNLIIGVTLAGLAAVLPAQAQTDACQATRRELAYGQAATEDAKDQQGFLRAAQEFEKAVKKAPNCAAAYFNLGLVSEKGGRLSAAKSAYERYLKLDPKAPDASSVEQLIFKLEYRIKRAGQTKPPKPEPPKRRSILEANGRWCLVGNANNNFCVTIIISGSRIEAQARGYCDGSEKSPGIYTLWHGTVNSNGDIEAQRMITCPSMKCQLSYSLTGTISPDMRRIRLQGYGPGAMSDDFCQILAYSNKLNVFEYEKR